MRVDTDAAVTPPRGDAYAMLPRPFQWVLAYPRPALWLGAASGLGYLLVASIAVGGGLYEPLGWKDSRSYWLDSGVMELSYALLFAWVPVAVAALVRGTERDASDLAPTLGADGCAWEALGREALAVGPRPLWWGALLGLFMTAGVAWIAFTGGLELDSAHTPATAVWTMVREVIIEVAVFCTLGWGVGAALGLGRLTREQAQLDLLDLEVLSPCHEMERGWRSSRSSSSQSLCRACCCRRTPWVRRS